MTPFEEQLRAALEDEGVASVRRRQNAGHLGDGGRGLEITLQWLREKDSEERADHIVKTDVMAKAAKKQVSDKWILAITSALIGAAASALFSWLFTRH